MDGRKQGKTNVISETGVSITVPLVDYLTFPFDHWVVDYVVSRNDAINLASYVATHWTQNKNKWVLYNNDCERRKWANPNPHDIPGGSELFDGLSSKRFIDDLCEITGECQLFTDPTLHGAGFHIVEPDGYLAPHLDYALHPKIPNMERRVNLIMFLNGGSREDGGAFELWNDTATEVQGRVYPKPGSAVIWKPGDVEFHGTQLVKREYPRIAAAMYYLAPARPNVSRKRALFIPQRGDPSS